MIFYNHIIVLGTFVAVDNAPCHKIQLTISCFKLKKRHQDATKGCYRTPGKAGLFGLKVAGRW
jgi:hypothetical protein